MVTLKHMVRVGVGAAAVAVLLGGVAAQAAEWDGGAPKVSRVQYQDPRYGDPRNGDPRYGGPRNGDPRSGDPRNEERRDDRGGGPGGTYQRSCREVRQDGPMLTAVCSDGRGRESQSSIDVNQCRGSDISNNRGVLQCGNVRGR